MSTATNPVVDPVTARFPDGFRWGTATAAHQIEGGNWNNDWWRFEHTPGSAAVEASGDACDSWNRWAEDADLVASLGLGNYRFSVEWSRVEPEDGLVSHAALAHYRRQCEGLLARGVDPVITLHHFTTPRWLADLGGWAEPVAVERFGRFAQVVLEALGDVAHSVCTLNEPNVVAQCGYLFGVFPPGQRIGDGWKQVCEQLIAAHRVAVDVARAVVPSVPVGLTVAMADWVAVDGADTKMERYRHLMEDQFLAATAGDDFVGVQAYSRERLGPTGTLPPEEGVPELAMGYEYWPQAVEGALRHAWEVTSGAVPLVVTENGIGTDDDTQRIAYMHGALGGVLRAIDDGIDVRGYTYWSLLDNFEWAFGYRPRFGLHEVDRTTFARTAKPSAAWFGEIARTNQLVDPPAAN
jgi:beta-glucosidase